MELMDLNACHVFTRQSTSNYLVVFFVLLLKPNLFNKIAETVG